MAADLSSPFLGLCHHNPFSSNHYLQLFSCSHSSKTVCILCATGQAMSLPRGVEITRTSVFHKVLTDKLSQTSQWDRHNILYNSWSFCQWLIKFSAHSESSLLPHYFSSKYSQAVTWFFSTGLYCFFQLNLGIIHNICSIWIAPWNDILCFINTWCLEYLLRSFFVYIDFSIGGDNVKSHLG